MNNNMDVVRTIKVKAEQLPEKLKSARLKDGRSAQMLATYAGISTAYWYQLESGQRDIVSEEVIRKIEKVLNVDFGVNFKLTIAA